MIIGAHSILYSTNPDADRAFLRDAIGLSSVDVGGGWLIFGLPPSEIAVHPGEKNDVHEFYLMCDDVERFVDAMRQRNIACGPIRDQGWGVLTQVTLPGGGKLGVYAPRHARPEPMALPRAAAASKAPQRAGANTPKKPVRAAKPAPRKATKSAPKKKSARR